MAATGTWHHMMAWLDPVGPSQSFMRVFVDNQLIDAVDAVSYQKASFGEIVIGVTEVGLNDGQDTVVLFDNAVLRQSSLP